MFPAGAESCPCEQSGAECCVQDMPRGQLAPGGMGLLPCLQQGAGMFVPVVWSQSHCVLGVTKLPNSDVQRTLLLEQLSGPRTCVLSAEQLTLGVTQVCNPLD